MSRSQDLDDGAGVHNTPPVVRKPSEISTVPLTRESDAPPDFFWTLPQGVLEAELETRKTRYTSDDPKQAEKERDEAWAKTTKIVQRYSDEMIKRWNSEIDAYLTFAGLFSAVLTAFNVQSYILLQPAAPDPTLIALQQISLQLSSFSTGLPPTFVNSTHPPFQQGNTPLPPIPRWAIWLNTLWFTSLILSLASASIGIMVKQWLNEYTSGISSESESEAGISRHTARLRQYRLNNLIKWHVGDVVNTIPVLLQLSLALFLAGLLVLLWTLHPTVAGVASTLAGLLGAFTLYTVFAPLMKPGCAYLSPQSLALYHIICRGPSLIKAALAPLLRPLAFYLLDRPKLMRTPLRRLAYALWRWNPSKVPTWRGFEHSMVVTKGESLDVDIISTGYDIAMDPGLLPASAICLSGLQPGIHVFNCVEMLKKTDQNHFRASLSPYIGISTTDSPVIYDLWADSLLSFFISKLQQAKSLKEGPYRQIITFGNQLNFHFIYAENLLPWGHNLGTRGLERILTALSITAYHGPVHAKSDRRAFGVISSHLYLMLVVIRAILARCNLLKVPLGNIRLAAAAAHKIISTNHTPGVHNVPQLGMYMAAINIIMECILATRHLQVTREQGDLDLDFHIIPYADAILHHLTIALQPADDKGLTKFGPYSLFRIAEELSELVNIVTEEALNLPIDRLFPEHRLLALENAIIAVQSAIHWSGQSEDEYVVGVRSGPYADTLEQKLDRFRAFRLNRRPVAQGGPQCGTDISRTSTSVLISIEPRTSVLAELPASTAPASPHTPGAILEPPASIIAVERPAAPQSSWHYGVADDPQAWPPSSLYYSALDTLGPSLSQNM